MPPNMRRYQGFTLNQYLNADTHLPSISEDIFLPSMSSPDPDAMEDRVPATPPYPQEDEFSNHWSSSEFDESDSDSESPLAPRACSRNNRKGAQGKFRSAQEKSMAGLDIARAIQPLPQPKPKIIIHVMRSGESWHDLIAKSNDPRFDRIKCFARDPGLTPEGKLHARNLGRSFEAMDRIVYFLCSPLKRALMTAVSGFKRLKSRNVKLVAWHELRDHGDDLANMGAPIETLKTWQQEWNRHPDELEVDISLLKPDWEKKQSRDLDNLNMRAWRVRRQLYAIGKGFQDGKWAGCSRRPLPQRSDETPNIEILVIGHRNLFTTMDGSDNQDFFGMYKSYEFASEEMIAAGASKDTLVETETSKERRRCSGKHQEWSPVRLPKIGTHNGEGSARTPIQVEEADLIIPKVEGSSESPIQIE